MWDIDINEWDLFDVSVILKVASLYCSEN
jgi:hypothetical protein